MLPIDTVPFFLKFKLDILINIYINIATFNTKQNGLYTTGE